MDRPLFFITVLTKGLKTMSRILIALMLVACAPKVEVPANVTTCVQDKETGVCSNDMNVKHTITIELPTVLTDSCRKQFNSTDYPDPTARESGYQACVSEYINQLLEIINGFQPPNPI